MLAISQIKWFKFIDLPAQHSPQSEVMHSNQPLLHR